MTSLAAFRGESVPSKYRLHFLVALLLFAQSPLLALDPNKRITQYVMRKQRCILIRCFAAHLMKRRHLETHKQ